MIYFDNNPNIIQWGSEEVVEINDKVESCPESINKDPYEGWIVKIKILNLEETSCLLDQKQYKNIIL